MNDSDEIEVMDPEGNRVKMTRGEYGQHTLNAAKQYWDNLDAMRHFSLQFLNEGFPALSLEVAERAVELGKGQVRDLYVRAVGLAETGRLDAAAAAFDELRDDAAYPADIARATAGLGRVRARQDRMDEAAALLYEAVDIDPDNPAPMVELFNFMASQERIPEAVEKIQSVAQKYPRSAGPHRALAQVASASENKDGIRSEVFAAVERATQAELGDVLAEGTMLLGQSGQPQEIIRLLEPRLDAVNNPFAYMNLAIAYSETGRTADARSLLMQLRDSGPPQLRPAVEARLKELGS